MKQSCIRIFFFTIFLLCTDNYLVAKKSTEPVKASGNLSFKIDPLIISQEFMASFVKNHPLIFTGIISGTLWSTLYSDTYKELKKDLANHPHIIFSSCMLLIFSAYLHKEKILNYIAPPETDEFDEEDYDDDDQNYYSQYEKFSKSNVKIYGPGQIKTTFQDVAGLQSAKEDLTDILLFLKNSKKFNDIGAHVPKGILLSGAPGNGKTLLARALAGEAQCPFLYVTASSMMEAIVGVGAARIRHLFTIAKELAPCIIFIDEIDAIGKKRSASGLGGDSEMAQTLNQLLSEMDGFEQHQDPIIIIGATNRVSILDEALLRPGRFDRKIEVHAPYIKDRVEILKVHFKNVKTSSDINFEKIACGTVGFSGADLANLVNEAALLALREDKSMVDMFDVDKARDFMLLGRETKGMDLSKQELWETAVHESGHALAHVYQKNAVPLYKVTITPRGHALGVTHSMQSKEKYSQTEEELRAEIIVLLAGSVAEEIIFQHRTIGTQSDLHYARKVATAMVMKHGMTQEFKDVTFEEFIDAQVHLPDSIATKLHQEITKIINECRVVTTEIIMNHQAELLGLAEMLMDQGTVSGDQVYQLCGIPEPKLQFYLHT